MKIDLSNCGGIRFKDYGNADQMTTFWWGEGHYTKPVGGLTFRIDIGGQYSGTYDMMMPGFRDTSRPLLVVDGRIYVDDVAILGSSGSSFTTTGGYLGTVNSTYTVSYNGSSGSITVPTLGVIYRASFAGGINLKNISSPGTQYTYDDPDWTRGNESTVLTANGKSCLMKNYYFNSGATIATGASISGRARGLLGVDQLFSFGA